MKLSPPFEMTAFRANVFLKKNTWNCLFSAFLLSRLF